MDMVGVTSRSNSSSKRATMARVMRWSSAIDRARVRLSTASAAAFAARLWGSTRSQSKPVGLAQAGVDHVEERTETDRIEDVGSSVVTVWPAASSSRPACSTAAMTCSSSGRPRADTVHRATRRRPGSAPTSSASGRSRRGAFHQA